MPALNSERFIGEAVQSVLDQTFTDLELLVVDNGSTDTTREVVERFADPRIAMLSEPRQGISRAMNAGLQAARGTFISRLDSDDVWLPELLETLVGVLESKPGVGLAYARAVGMDEERRELAAVWGRPLRYPDDALRSLAYMDTICNIAVLVRRECFECTGSFDVELRTSEDWDMWLRLACYYRMVCVDRVLARVRVHSGSTTSPQGSRYGEVLEERRLVLDKLFARSDLPARLRSMRGTAYSNVFVETGLRWLGKRELRRGARALIAGVRVSPRPAFTAARILWFGLSGEVLSRHRLGRRFAAGVERLGRRLRGGAR
ncbi:MAG: glycosyltransferase [Acidobacteriia bacterium]|nr:glycosyltransferase [Terriglobia bacterium]